MASGVVLSLSMDRGCASPGRWNGLRGSGLSVRSPHRVGFLIEFWLLGGPRPPPPEPPPGRRLWPPLGRLFARPLGVERLGSRSWALRPG